MTPTDADHLITQIRGRLTRLAWSDSVWADFREAMIRIRIDAEQGLVCVKNVVMASKGSPSPAHFLEAFRNAQGFQPVTCSPGPIEEEPKGEFWHPRGWAIVRGWTVLRDERNWEKVPGWMADFYVDHGWLPNWEDVISPLAHEKFTSNDIATIGLFVNAIGREERKQAVVDKWAEDRRERLERQRRKVEAIRKKIGGAA